jgi:p-aminobenzoyl-glutamate transporter AbgT
VGVSRFKVKSSVVVTAATQPITETKNEKTVTTTDDFTLNLDTPTRNSLIGILVVLVLIVGCCFGCGTLTICFYQVTKTAKQV